MGLVPEGLQRLSPGASDCLSQRLLLLSVSLPESPGLQGPESAPPADAADQSR